MIRRSYTKCTIKKIRVVLIGGSGYAGFEVIRLLLRHPQAELVGVYGPANELGPMEQFYPPADQAGDAVAGAVRRGQGRRPSGADLAMLCVPHKVAMSYVPQLRKRRASAASTGRPTTASRTRPSTRNGTARTPTPRAWPRRSTACRNTSPTRSARPAWSPTPAATRRARRLPWPRCSRPG